ncbi:MAG: hypothetical protein MUF75_12310 [Bacteroidia bacterium]|jgi:hypothetical protein|nr:hypothetical protein [Bacteroidia bacterium]
MKLYVVNNHNQKVYLNLNARTRRELVSQIGGYNFFLSNKLYSVNDVIAENDSNSTATGAVVGGVVGAIGGPIGILIGGLLGGLFGNTTDEEESVRVKIFNES